MCSTMRNCAQKYLERAKSTSTSVLLSRLLVPVGSKSGVPIEDISLSQLAQFLTGPSRGKCWERKDGRVTFRNRRESSLNSRDSAYLM